MASTGLTQRASARAADSDKDSDTNPPLSSSSSSSPSSFSSSSSSSSSSRHLPPSSSFPVDEDSSTWLDVFLTFVILTLMALSISYITTQTLHFGLMSRASVPSLATADLGTPVPVSTPESQSQSSQSQSRTVDEDVGSQPGSGSGSESATGAEAGSGSGFAEVDINSFDPITPAEAAAKGITLGADGKPRKRFRRKKVSPRTFTLEELSTFDGSDPDKPIYISVKGHVYDVSAGKQYYSKGHGYNIFAGRDCTRAFVTGCFKEKYPGHDLRGLTQEQIKDVDNWLKFYQDHAQYFYVGELILPELGPNDPLPNPDCTTYDEPGVTPVPDNNDNQQAPKPTDTAAEATDAATVEARVVAEEAPIVAQNNVEDIPAPTPVAT